MFLVSEGVSGVDIYIYILCQQFLVGDYFFALQGWESIVQKRFDCGMGLVGWLCNAQ